MKSKDGRISGVLVLLAILVFGIAVFYLLLTITKNPFEYFSNGLKDPAIESNFQKQDTEQPQSELREYTSDSLGFKIMIPTTFTVTEYGTTLEVQSPKYKCRVKGTAEPYAEMSEYRLVFKMHDDKNYNQAWKTAFGFEFVGENSYDGIAKIGGGEAYYFFQGAEMSFSRTAYLVKVNETSSLEINEYKPSYLFECEEGSLDYGYSKMGGSILSGLEFTQ